MGYLCAVEEAGAFGAGDHIHCHAIDDAGDEVADGFAVYELGQHGAVGEAAGFQGEVWFCLLREVLRGGESKGLHTEVDGEAWNGVLLHVLVVFLTDAVVGPFGGADFA